MTFIRAAVGVLALPCVLGAQNSSCCDAPSPYVKAGIISRGEGEGLNHHQWLQAVVLWRSQKRFGVGISRDSLIVLTRQADAARASSLELGRVHLGGVFGNGYQYADYSHDGRLWVLNKQFSVSWGDSALVVMVGDVDAPTGAVILGQSRISAELPDGYWGKEWTSGDTIFTIRGKNRSELLLQALRTSPTVRAYLDAAGRER